MVNLIRSIDSSSEVGCSVGTCWAILSSFNICKSVVFPALSSPKNSNFPDFFHNPRYPRAPVNQSHKNMASYFLRRNQEIFEAKLTFVTIQDQPLKWRKQKFKWLTFTLTSVNYFRLLSFHEIFVNKFVCFDLKFETLAYRRALKNWKILPICNHKTDF